MSLIDAKAISELKKALDPLAKKIGATGKIYYEQCVKKQGVDAKMCFMWGAVNLAFAGTLINLGLFWNKPFDWDVVAYQFAKFILLGVGVGFIFGSIYKFEESFRSKVSAEYYAIQDLIETVRGN